MRRLVSWSIAGFVALGMAAVACGGATSTDLLDSPSGDGGAASSGSTSSGSSGSTSSSSSGSTSSSSSGSTSSSSSSSSSGGDAGPTAKIKCGSSFCTPGTQVCCRKPGLPNEYNCTAPNACNSAGSLTIPCDDATDCSAAGQPGTVCCGRTASARSGSACRRGETSDSCPTAP